MAPLSVEDLEQAVAAALQAQVVEALRSQSDLADLYEVLLVDQNATLDEIKLAFKKRALQVHPDKGGSKEAFHLVYQALETLGDPESRKRYDTSLHTTEASPWPRRKDPKTPRSKGPKGPKGSKGPKGPRPKAPQRSGVQRSRAHPQAPGRQTKLLEKLRDLLKRLPREVRNEVISKEFSQKQRLILEKWMVDMKLPALATPEAATAQPAAAVQPAAGAERAEGHGASVLPKQKSKGRMASRKRNGTGNIKKDTRYASSYSARICFDSLELDTRYCDLQTALENLVILTSIKQKMRFCGRDAADFQQRLQEAIDSSAKEHGKNSADLHLRFAVAQAAGAFIGPRILLRSPRVQSVEVLGQIRSCLDPFRMYARKGSSNIFSLHSPVSLAAAWDNLQVAIAEAWKMAGADSTAFLRKCCALREARRGAQNRQLELWERQQMASEDSRRRRILLGSSSYRERRERRHMALHDNKPRLKAMRNMKREKWERQEMAKEDERYQARKSWACGKEGSKDALAKRLLDLKKLLVRWGQIIKNETQQLEKERRKLLKQRKKDREERKRREAWNRKRCRDEERLKREASRKRMKWGKWGDGTMNDIPWI